MKTRKKHRVAYMRHFSALWKHCDLVFHGRDTFPPFFRVGNERSSFRHICVITFLFFLISVTFPVRYFFSFLTHLQDRIINVSDILPLRTIEVNDGLQVMKFEPAPIIRPNFFDPLLVTVLTGFQCNWKQWQPLTDFTYNVNAHKYTTVSQSSPISRVNKTYRYSPRKFAKAKFLKHWSCNLGQLNNQLAMDPSQRGHYILKGGGVVAVSKLTAVIEKKAAKLSRSCYTNKAWCPKEVSQGLFNLTF